MPGLNLARLLHLLPPEAAHRAALTLLPYLPAPPQRARPRLRVRLAGLDLPHPLGLAAGFDKDGQAFAALLRQGFACVEVGTVTPRPQPGNPRPRLFRLVEDGAVINRMGFNNAGAAALAQRLAQRREGGIVGVNIGMNKGAEDPVADYVACFARLQAHADYVTVNVSSPNTAGLRALQEQDALERLLSALADARERSAPMRRVPLFLKVAPDLNEAGEAGIAALLPRCGVDALIVSNTTVQRPASLRSRRAAEAGGLSGRPLLAPSTRLLARFAVRLEGRVPLIGVGGIASAADAYAKIRAGAAACQLYTALVFAGPALVADILDGLEACLDRDGFAMLDEAVGRDAAQLAEIDPSLPLT